MFYWFNTLNDALGSEGLVDLWPFGVNISYGETKRIAVELEPAEGRKKAKYRLISIYRSDSGLYERPITYIC